VAQRPANPISTTFADFDRAFDELFEDLLLSRWRGDVRGRGLDGAAALESETEYRVRIDASGIEPDRIEVEASDRRLLVRMAGPARTRINTLDFSHAIDPDGVTARLAGGALEIVLPKKRGRIIEVR
jgi:HSP20 family molecular chaperone IbpA